jgi:acyl carrier protein
MLTLDTGLDEMGVDSMSLMATIAQIEAVYDCQFVSDQVIGLFQAERVRDVVLLVIGMVGEDRCGDRRPG